MAREYAYRGVLYTNTALYQTTEELTMRTTFRARTSLITYKGMVFPVMRFFPKMTGMEMRHLWRTAWNLGTGIGNDSVTSGPPCATALQWNDRAYAALVAAPRIPNERDGDAIVRLVDSVFHESHCVLVYPIECYLRLQCAVRIEAERVPLPSRN